ncbi:putative quinol monooxygenase [Nocardia sp. CDC153]|uniref:putative quinol monooxygenase n=1 Tax=Nocardia sp. CDC153 TaxID=3112167 RepID=UPI002DB74446|nr:putative quinol monooxygenase [Nocardia sp. CDC153]MEC3957934.1 putative quinol monooxygenase [Nocardia sp. CDC153]
MAIRHIISIRVAAGRAAEFAAAFNAVRAHTLREEGCEQYDLYQNTTDPDALVMLERWTDQQTLEKHMATEHTESADLLNPLISLWEPGSTPTVERYED